MTLEEIGKNLPALLGALMLGILFIQSGLDKVFDWKGNLEWLNGHFSKTFLGGFVPVLVGDDYRVGNCNRIFERDWRDLFSRFGFARFDFLCCGSWARCLCSRCFSVSGWRKIIRARRCLCRILF